MRSSLSFILLAALLAGSASAAPRPTAVPKNRRLVVVTNCNGGSCTTITSSGSISVGNGGGGATTDANGNVYNGSNGSGSVINGGSGSDNDSAYDYLSELSTKKYSLSLATTQGGSGGGTTVDSSGNDYTGANGCGNIINGVTQPCSSAATASVTGSYYDDNPKTYSTTTRSTASASATASSAASTSAAASASGDSSGALPAFGGADSAYTFALGATFLAVVAGAGGIFL